MPLSRRRAGRHRAAHRDVAPARPLAPARLLGQAVVLALVVAGTTAFTGLHATVTLEVDGRVRTVTTFGGTVGDVLAAHRVAVGEHDLVVPDPGTRVSDGQDVVVRRAQEVVVEVDGRERTLWTTGTTAAEIVEALGVRGDVRALPSRSAGAGRAVLAVSTPKALHVVADGERRTVETSAATVREALLEAGVVLGPDDRVSVPLESATVEGLAVLVTRVTAEVRTETTTQPFETVRTEDPELAVGSEVVEVAGAEGVRTLTYEAHMVGAVEVGRTVVAETVVREPVQQVIRVGTKVAPELPPAVPPVDPGSARAIALDMVLARGWDADQFACLDRLWTKESGWQVTAENRSSGAYGIPQALPGSKMGTVADDWRTNAATQITWGLGYISGRYGTPCGAWAHSQAVNWY